MKNRAGRQRGLVTTSFTGIQMTRPMQVSSVVLTARAPITLRPTQIKAMFLTSFFGPKPFLKRQETQAFLLHNIYQFS